MTKEKKRLDIKNPDISQNNHICEFNKLSLDKYDQEFINDMNRVISDETIPEQDDINNCDVIDGYVNI